MQSVDPSKIIWSRMLLHCWWQVGVSVQEVKGPGEQMCPQSVSELGGPAVRIAFSSLGCLVWTGGELTPVCILQADFNLLHWQWELPLCFFHSPFLFHSVSYFFLSEKLPFLSGFPSFSTSFLWCKGEGIFIAKICGWLYNEILIHRSVCCITALY